MSTQSNCSGPNPDVYYVVAFNEDILHLDGEEVSHRWGFRPAGSRWAKRDEVAFAQYRPAFQSPAYTDNHGKQWPGSEIPASWLVLKEDGIVLKMSVPGAKRFLRAVRDSLTTSARVDTTGRGKRLHERHQYEMSR